MAIRNQPNNLNLLQAISFETSFQRIPNCSYFCQKVAIPSMVLGTAVQSTFFSDIPVEGEKLSFDPLNISFVVDEDMQNYQEIYNWLLSIGFPDEHSQFTSLQKPPNNNQTDGMYSDISILVNTNKAKPSYNIVFKDAFPITLGSIEFDAAAESLDPIIVDASFMFTSIFTIEKLVTS